MFSYEQVKKCLQTKNKKKGTFDVLIATESTKNNGIWVPQTSTCIGQVTLTDSVDNDTQAEITKNIQETIVTFKGTEAIIYAPEKNEFLGFDKLFYIGFDENKRQPEDLTVYLKEELTFFNNILSNLDKRNVKYSNATPKGGRKRSTKKRNKKGTQLKKVKSIRVKGRRK